MLVKTLVLTLNDIEFNDLDDSNSIHCVEQAFYSKFKQQIKAFLQGCLGDDENIDEYEDGPDSWFGNGSVMLYELSIEISIKFKAEVTTMVLEFNPAE